MWPQIYDERLKCLNVYLYIFSKNQIGDCMSILNNVYEKKQYDVLRL